LACLKVPLLAIVAAVDAPQFFFAVVYNGLEFFLFHEVAATLAAAKVINAHLKIPPS
jgi:hypothetical protein